MNGAIIYQGPSLLDGVPIVAIATGLKRSSENSKTGDMVQTYILLEDIAPTEAVKTGQDASVCGQCPHRGRGDGKERTCYVNVGQAPLGVWRAYKRGSYPVATDVAALGEKRVVRLGSYGDPAAVPVEVWRNLTDNCVAHTGYTHQWRNAPQLRTLCMASADSVVDAAEARLQGWRTFRVAMPCDPPKMTGESVCPASKEAGKILACSDCRACGGADGRKGSIVIQAHGGFGVMNAIQKKAA